MGYTQEQIDRANQVNLEQFLRSQGEQLIKSGQEFRWKAHDSLTVKGNRWFRHSQSKGGFYEKRSGSLCLPPPVNLSLVFKELLITQFRFLVIKLIFFLLAFVFFLFLLFDLEHETDSVDQSDQEGKDKSAAENVTD